MRLAAFTLVALVGCSSSDAAKSNVSADGGTATTPTTVPSTIPTTTTSPVTGANGNPNGKCDVSIAPLEDVSSPKTVIGTGTAASCTGAAVVDAVAKGGIITFSCGDAPVTITLTATAKVFNDTGPKIVIDGGGKVTLSGGGKIRILYMNVCDKAQVYTSSDCNNQNDPELTLQNIGFDGGNSSDIPDTDNAGGGGAVWVRGGRLKVINARFTNNVCASLGSDLGGGALRVLDFPTGGSVNRPVYIVDSTFDGNSCANGGALSSIGTSYTVLNSVFTKNLAVGNGANSGQGGNGGAIYNDGNTYALNVCGSDFENDKANEGGSAIFYVSNDRSGTMTLTNSTLKNNPRGTFETPNLPGIYVLAKSPPVTTGSDIER